jgi:mediator of RNA polymerase II transcription subunit 12
MLEHFLPLDPLTAVVETIHRHLTVWACMQSSRKIAVALYTAHQTWRTEGIQSRALLALLVEVDGGQLLDSASRAHIEADISAFTHVSSPLVANILGN